MSKSGYARHVGVSETAIRSAIADGKIKSGWDEKKKKIIMHLADEEYGHLHQVATAKPGVSKVQRAKKVTGNDNSKQAKPKPREANKKNSDKFDDESDGAYSFDHSEDFIEDTFAELGDTYEELLLKIPVTSDLQYNEAVRRREIIQLALEKKKLEELQTVLVRRENVERMLFGAALILKRSLMMIPARIADDILAANNKVEVMNIMSKELTDILLEYANTGLIDLTVKTR